jgi:heterodisulfide reductase subunit B2
MSIAYYPGCSLHGTGREYDESMRAVAPALGLQLTEIEDWSCCGASSAHGTNHLLGVALPARNLALAEEQGHDSVVAPCASCFSRLAVAHHEIAQDAELAETVSAVIERPFSNSVDVLNVIQFLLPHLDTIRERVSASAGAAPMRELKVAAYYGCLLVRPVDVAGADNHELPTTMEQVISACGAQPVKWNMAVECCGAGLSMARTTSVVRLGRRIIEDARKAGADAIIVGCPMCHSNLDFRQTASSDPMPVLYLTELVGLALGIAPEKLGMGRHFVDTRPLLAKLAEKARGQAESAATEAAQKAAVVAEKLAASVGTVA